MGTRLLEERAWSAELALRSATGRWVVVATVAGSALAGIDATVVGIALPAIGRDLGTSFAGLQWTVTAYTLALASFILLGGAAGDRYGRRRVFLVGVAWFTGASALCSLAPNVELLVSARALQGIGGALLAPASLAIIEASFRTDDRGAAVGLWAGFSGVSGAIAPFIAGWLLAWGSWRWVFLINPPLAVLITVVALRWVPESRGDASTGRLDWIGALLTVAFLGLASLALIESRGRLSSLVAAAAAASALAFAAFLWWERRTPNPLLPLSLFRIRQFSSANAVTFTVYGPIAVFFFLLVLQLQVVAGWTPVASGAATIPVTVITLALSRRSGALAQLIGPRLQMSAGPFVCCAGCLLATKIGSGSGPSIVLLTVIVFGLGLVTMVAPLTATALGSVSSAHAGAASGVNNALARTASLLAIAAVPVVAGLDAGGVLQPREFSAGFVHAMVICSVLFVIGGLLAAVTIRRPAQVPT